LISTLPIQLQQENISEVSFPQQTIQASVSFTKFPSGDEIPLSPQETHKRDDYFRILESPSLAQNTNGNFSLPLSPNREFAFSSKLLQSESEDKLSPRVTTINTLNASNVYQYLHNQQEHQHRQQLLYCLQQQQLQQLQQLQLSGGEGNSLFDSIHRKSSDNSSAQIKRENTNYSLRHSSGHSPRHSSDVRKKSPKKRKTSLNTMKLYCHECGKKDTPEWRKGPDGPATCVILLVFKFFPSFFSIFL
jgi:hypothetical protein